MKEKDKEVTIASATISTEFTIAQENKIKKKKIKELGPRECHEYLTLFEEEERKVLPPHGYSDHKIELDPSKDIPNKRLYPMKGNKLNELRVYRGKNLSRGWIRELESPVRASILFVKRKDGSLRLSVDYRGVNAVTKKDRYSLPLIGEALDRLSTAKYYTCNLYGLLV